MEPAATRSDPLPDRHVARLLNAFSIDTGSFALRAVGRNFDRVAVFMMCLRTALQHGGGHGLSGNAIAASLGRPLETVRRQLLALVADGFCTLSNRRFALAPDFLDQPRVEAAVAGVLATFETLVTRMATAGLAPAAGLLDRPRNRIAVTALDIYLASFELNESKLPNLIDLRIHGTFAVLNAKALIDDPVLGLRYGQARTVPPVELRQPATARAIADRDGFPLVTIRRRIAGLVKAGALQQVPGGYLLSELYVNSEQVSERSLARVLHLRRALARLGSG